MKQTVKVLLMAADPTNASRLRVNSEFRDVRDRVRASVHSDQLEMAVETGIRRRDLQRCLLEHRPTVLHFSGHGSRSGSLVVEDEVGRSVAMEPTAVAKVLAALPDNLRLVFLNACFSDRQAAAIAEVVDFVVAMDDAVKDAAAIAFAAAFYEALAYGRSIETAFDLGKAALALEGRDSQAKLPTLRVRIGADASEALINPLLAGPSHG